jgi:hypothetical protein
MAEKFERRPFYLDAIELLDSHWAFEIRREAPWLRAGPDSGMRPSERVRASVYVGVCPLVFKTVACFVV